MTTKLPSISRANVVTNVQLHGQQPIVWCQQRRRRRTTMTTTTTTTTKTNKKKHRQQQQQQTMTTTTTITMTTTTPTTLVSTSPDSTSFGGKLCLLSLKFLNFCWCLRWFTVGWITVIVFLHACLGHSCSNSSLC